MGVRLRSWWQQIKQHRIAIGVVAIVSVVAIALIIAGYWFDWTGFSGYNQVTTAHTISGPSTGTVTRTEVSQPGKTLIIPVVLAIAGFWLNRIQKDREQKDEEAQKQREENAAKEREKLERESREDNQRETALQAYIDKISELLLKEHLGELTADGKLKPEYKHVRNVARVRTITVLTQLDARRVGYVFAFLREAGLISTTSNDNVVSFSNADLHAVNWSHANLSEATLFRARLSNANLNGATLNSANLNGVDLSDADLMGAAISEEQLKQPKTLKGATMPDGSIHP
jgi:uncharacterized protein YjbI with pentapeptide repeats